MKTIPVDQMSRTYCPSLNRQQHRANTRYFKAMWTMLNDGGIYIWPDRDKAFKKVAGGFEEVA